MIIIEGAEEVPRRRRAGRPGHHQRRHEKAGDPVDDEITVAVPVGGDDREAARHRLDDHQAEGLLEVVDQGDEDVGRVPDGRPPRGFGAVDERDPNAGREGAAPSTNASRIARFGAQPAISR